MYDFQPEWITQDDYKDDVQDLKGKALDILIQSAKRFFVEDISTESVPNTYVCKMTAEIADTYLLPQFVDSMNVLRSSLDSLGEPTESAPEAILEKK